MMLSISNFSSNFYISLQNQKVTDNYFVVNGKAGLAGWAF